jgi:hypothetical protein
VGREQQRGSARQLGDAVAVSLTGPEERHLVGPALAVKRGQVVGERVRAGDAREREPRQDRVVRALEQLITGSRFRSRST